MNRRSNSLLTEMENPELAPQAERPPSIGGQASTFWLTGLSGAGKSTLAMALKKRFEMHGRACCVLDGDQVRQGLNRDLGFSPDARKENIRRVAEVARLMNDAGLIVITALISPYRDDRAQALQIIGAHSFVEIYLDTPLEACEKRDPKRLYERARIGQIPSFTGITAPYEPPDNPALTLDTSRLGIDDCVDRMIGMWPDAERGEGQRQEQRDHRHPRVAR